MNYIRENALFHIIGQNADSPEMRDFVTRRFLPMLTGDCRRRALLRVGKSDEEARALEQPATTIVIPAGS